MVPNVLFALYCLIAVPIFLASKPLSVSTIGEFIGYSIIPMTMIIIFNKKKESKGIKIATTIVIILWILITVFGTLGKMGMRM